MAPRCKQISKSANGKKTGVARPSVVRRKDNKRKSSNTPNRQETRQEAAPRAGLAVQARRNRVPATGRQTQSYKKLSQNTYFNIERIHLTKGAMCECEDKGDATCSPDECMNAIGALECSSKCHKTCQNRKISTARGKDKKVEVFDTLSERGSGLRATEQIEKGELVLEFVGEVINKAEFERRKFEYIENKHTYTCQIGGGYYIDPTKKGNLARFANHHCAPNMILQRWYVPGTRHNLQRLGLFAERTILHGEEVTWDYGTSFGNGTEPCACGAENCRGTL